MRLFSRYNRKLAWLWVVALLFTLAGQPASAAAACMDLRPTAAAPAAKATASSQSACGMKSQGPGKECCCTAEKAANAAPSHRAHAPKHGSHGQLAVTGSCGCQLEQAPASQPAEPRKAQAAPIVDAVALPSATPTLTLAAPLPVAAFESPSRSLRSPDFSPSGSRAPPVR